MFRIIMALAFVAVISGCATSPARNAESAPSERVYAYQDQAPAIIRVTRDEGFFGSLCGAVVYIDGERAAKLGPGETAAFNVTEGKHIVSADMSKAACNAGMRETQVDIAEGGRMKLRISTGGNGDLSIAPTAF